MNTWNFGQYILTQTKDGTEDTSVWSVRDNRTGFIFFVEFYALSKGLRWGRKRYSFFTDYLFGLVCIKLKKPSINIFTGKEFWS